MTLPPVNPRIYIGTCRLAYKVEELPLTDRVAFWQRAEHQKHDGICGDNLDGRTASYQAPGSQDSTEGL